MATAAEAEEPVFAPIDPHPSKTVKREDVPVLLHERPVTDAKMLIRVLRDHLPDKVKRLVLVCEEFDQMVLPDVMDKFEEWLNIVIIECPNFGKDEKEHLHSLAELSGARILKGDADESLDNSPFGQAEFVEVSAESVVSFRVGDRSVVIADANEVMVIHATEDGEENEEERLARLACEDETS